MEITTCTIEGLRIITPRVFGDERGFFVESYLDERYREATQGAVFVQDNMSSSQKGVLRGLHFQQPPFAQGKLVSVVKGSVFDVAVDIRENSPTYGHHVSVTLGAPTHTDGVWEWKQFWIPEGFAHGFVALEDDTVFTYKCTNVYSPEHDGGLMWNDATIGIAWPQLDMDYIISQKDMQHPTLNEYKNLNQ